MALGRTGGPVYGQKKSKWNRKVTASGSKSWKPKFNKKKFKSNFGKGTIGLAQFRANDPFPPICHKKMTYCESGQLRIVPSGSQLFSAVDEYVWKLNDVLDPYVGTLPAILNASTYGMNEMAQLYNRYKVTGCMIEITFFDPSADGLVVGLIINNPSNAVVLAGKYIGDVGKRPQGWVSSLANTGSQKLNFKQYFPMHTLCNLTKLQFKVDIDNLTSPTTGSPGSLPKLHLNMADSTARSSGSDLFMQFTIKLTYFTEFYQRKQYT